MGCDIGAVAAGVALYVLVSNGWCGYESGKRQDENGFHGACPFRLVAVVSAGFVVVVTALAICAARMRPSNASGQGKCCENCCGDAFHCVSSLWLVTCRIPGRYSPHLLFFTIRLRSPQ